MFNVKVTINGKPATQANIRNELEKTMLEAAIEAVQTAIRTALTPSEAQQITVDFQGRGLDNLSAKIGGPDDLVAKVNAALS